jgi:hypothetical protein
MPLQLPNLDDRRYNDLVAEALTRIPTYSPEWTNHNSSDPGITLVELFAYLADMLLYRLNRVTDDNTRKFLKLLNDPDWATGDLREEIRKAVLGIRERYRAVTKDDYEFLSTESFNQWLLQTVQSSNNPAVRTSLAAINLVARAHCVPQRNLDAGTEADRLQLKPEHVSVVIVPAPERPNLNPPPEVVTAPSNTPSPQPSAAQISALFSFLDERRMLTTKLHVTGPFYAHVSAQLVIARNSDALDADLITAIHASLTNLLNPLPSDTGGGWEFGHDVFVSEIYETLEMVPGIDFITDVMLSTQCTPGDDKCVLADPIWHTEGDLVGLSIQEHHLPVFDSTSIVIAANSAFVIVNLSVSAKAQANADLALLKRSIKSRVRGIFHPGLGGPGPTTATPTNIFVSDIQVAIKNIAGVLNPAVAVECTPSNILQTDKDRGLFIHVAAGNVVDWHVTIQLS